jgi:hypothetical protein
MNATQPPILVLLRNDLDEFASREREVIRFLITNQTLYNYILNDGYLTAPSSLYAHTAFTNLACWDEAGDIAGARVGIGGIALGTAAGLVTLTLT